VLQPGVRTDELVVKVEPITGSGAYVCKYLSLFANEVEESI